MVAENYYDYLHLYSREDIKYFITNQLIRAINNDVCYKNMIII